MDVGRQHLHEFFFFTNVLSCPFCLSFEHHLPLTLILLHVTSVTANTKNLPVINEGVFGQLSCEGARAEKLVA